MINQKILEATPTKEADRSMAGNSPPPTSRVTQPDLSNMRQFLTTPIPKSCGVVQCYIKRNKFGTNKLFPIYSLYLKV